MDEDPQGKVIDPTHYHRMVAAYFLLVPDVPMELQLDRLYFDEIRARFVNTLYGYSVGKRLAFPVVENYVKHAWAKFGLKRVMLNHGFFLFQFDSSTSMEKVMEVGPWRIKLVPIILKVLMRNTILKRENVSTVPLWVKMHNVPIVAYSKVGLDLISTKVGRLTRLDAHTNNIYCNSWGHSDYVRALVEVSAEAPLVDSVDPPRCGTCKNFKHLEAMCPMKLMECPKKKCINESELSKGNGPVRATGRKNKESDKHVRDNMGMSSSDTTKTDTPLDSSRKVYHDDNINIDELRAFVVNKMEKEKVLDEVAKINTHGCSPRQNGVGKVSFSKPSSSLEVLNADSDTDEDEVFPPDVGCSRPSSSFGDGHQLEDEILNAYDDYEDQIEDFPGQLQEICDQFDFWIKSLDGQADGPCPKFLDCLIIPSIIHILLFNVAKILSELRTSYREDAVHTLAYEADVRLGDPVYGCVIISSLLQEIEQAETRAKIALLGLARSSSISLSIMSKISYFQSLSTISHHIILHK
uniref:DUF4283 domain-containing protein n=1 Tax=Tanacetum cinerariifolium TaxID=118510 RepID=A0A6L2J9S6_TANCI|nr:hypothetical protein [Tanacetum cinerariifolium]